MVVIDKGLCFLRSSWYSCVVVATVFVNGLLILIPSCSSSENNTELENVIPDKETLIQTNQKIMKSESVDIEEYLTRRNYDMTITSTGLRYMIYDSSGTGNRAQTDDYITVSYTVSLLNGTEIYSSNQDGLLEFVLDKSEIASGLQEGIKYMKQGDKALLIIPAHLAYGLTGDGDKISHYEALVVDTELINISD